MQIAPLQSVQCCMQIFPIHTSLAGCGFFLIQRWNIYTAGIRSIQYHAINPNLIGPNGVNTSVNLGGAPFNDGDTYPNFFGTSAAAPHVAAVGALIIQGRKKFNLQTIVKPYEVRQQLITSAGKFSYLPGWFFF